MKHLILALITGIAITLSCTPEEIIKYIEKEPEYIEKIVNRYITDTVYVEVPRIDTVYEEVIVHDTIWCGCVRVDTVLIIDTVYIEVVRVDTVEREAKITYPPYFAEYVDSFFGYVDRGTRLTEMLVVDVNIYEPEGPNTNHSYSHSYISNGRWEIEVWSVQGCTEELIYRELAHTLFGVPYKPVDYDGIMNPIWFSAFHEHAGGTPPISECLNGMTEEERAPHLLELFGVIE